MKEFFRKVFDIFLVTLGKIFSENEPTPDLLKNLPKFERSVRSEMKCHAMI